MRGTRVVGVLLLAFLATLVLIGEQVSAESPSQQGHSARAVLAREFSLIGTVDCGKRSGARCQPDAEGRLVLWTESVSGIRERVIIDVSWILKQLDGLDQDDQICLDVQDASGGVLQAVGVVSRCGEEEPRKKVTPEKDQKVAAEPTVTPTTTVTPTITHTPTNTPTATATPIINLSLTKTGILGLCSRAVCETIWTITVTNTGPSVAHNVVVIDRPINIASTVTTSSPSQGSFNPATNRWTVGTVGVGPGNAQTLTITFGPAIANTMTREWTNDAEVESADEFDSNSTPNNNDPAEDDQASDSVLEPD